tara:strand:- start:1466 stop:1681 length:216 start_codon:yes stop_codon:yes gene_type:complete
MTPMTMTCVCTEEVSSIVLIPSSSKAIFNVTTHRTLDDGTELSPETESVTVELPAALLEEVLALNVAPMPV